MPVGVSGVLSDLKDRKRAIETGMDPREKEERKEAAKAYAGENEQHFVDYMRDCIDTSRNSREEIRGTQQECWDIYNEDPPPMYDQKESWQSKVVIPRPFGAVQYGAAAIRKAFSPDFLSVKDEINEDAQLFWKAIMDNQLSPAKASFIMRFSDAVIMALAIGESMVMIPKYVPGAGLRYDLVEPWKIHRDPDAAPRDPQSGLYWIHQEWLDFHVLKQGEKDERYQNIDAAFDTEGEDPSDPYMTREAIADRKKQIWQRSKFRRLGLVSEYWGEVLSPDGELLLSNATYTMAGNRIISLPKPSPYFRLRFPGVSFSPLPDLLASGGRGLLNGIRSVWDAMNNLMSLHMDAMNWVVYPPKEINVDALVDATDVEDWPGKKYLTHGTANGEQAIRQNRYIDPTNSVLANTQFLDQNFQRGAMVTDAIQGLPGYRKDMTYRESRQNLDQAMGVYSLMGMNLEEGAMNAVEAGRDVLESFAKTEELFNMLRYSDFEKLKIKGVVPKLSGRFHISGIQALMKDAEALKNIRELVLPMAVPGSLFAKYIRPYNVVKAIEKRSGLEDENVFVDEQAGIKMQEADLQAVTAPPMPGNENVSGLGGAAPPLAAEGFGADIREREMQ